LLSPRELEVLRLAAQGLTDPEIAERLVVSRHTVHRHMGNIRTKLNQRSKAAAVAKAAEEGLL
jgi:DNA-binding NarL/FixJ family response regulator